MATQDQVKEALKPFPKEYISSRTDRGVTLDYVSHSEVTRRLLQIDPEWSIDFCAYNDKGPVVNRDPISGCPTGAFFKFTFCGVPRVVFGSFSPSMKKDDMDKMKNGTLLWSDLKDVDAFKKIMSDAITIGAMRAGVALDLWSKITPSSLEEADAKRASDLAKILSASTDEIKNIAKAFLDGRKVSELSIEALDQLEKLINTELEKPFTE